MAATKAKPTYDVTTWDMERQKWTPQQGVRRGPYRLMALRGALRKLRNCGYSCDYRSHDYCGDPSVSVSRKWTDKEIKALRRQMRRAKVTPA